MTCPKIGDRVGASRWPYSCSHPAGWGRPWAGVLLAVDDPRAWAGSMAFHSATPDQQAVTAWVETCRARGLLGTHLPVLWTFGNVTRVFWESAEHVRPYAEDVAAWEAAQDAAYAREDRAGRRMFETVPA